MRAFSILLTSMAGLAAAIALTAPAEARPRVQIWTDRGARPAYDEGSAMRVKVRATMDAYLLVYEIDPNGMVSLLHPWKRGSDRIEAGRTLRLPPDGSDYQLVAEQLGRGYLVAIASERPFRELPWFLRPFDPQAASVGYEEESIHGEQDIVDGFGQAIDDASITMERIRRRVLQDPDAAEASAASYATYVIREPAPPPVVVLPPVSWPQEPPIICPGPGGGAQYPEPSAQREPPPDLGGSRQKDPPPQPQEPPRPPPVYKDPPPQPEPPRFANPPQAKPDRPDPPRGKGR